MSLGALTLTASDTRAPVQTIYVDELSVVGAASYTTGGDTGFKAALQALTKDQRTPKAVIPIGGNGGFVPVYDLANDKLMVFQPQKSDAAHAAPLIEVPSTTDLHTTTFKLL